MFKIETQYSKMPFINIYQTAELPLSGWDQQEIDDLTDCGYSFLCTRNGKFKFLLKNLKTIGDSVTTILISDITFCEKLCELGYRGRDLINLISENIESAIIHGSFRFEDIADYILEQAE